MSIFFFHGTNTQQIWKVGWKNQRSFIAVEFSITKNNDVSNSYGIKMNNIHTYMYVFLPETEDEMVQEENLGNHGRRRNSMLVRYLEQQQLLLHCYLVKHGESKQ